MTRVRLTIADYSKVNIEGLKAVDGVLGVVEDETLQVVLGTWYRQQSRQPYGTAYRCKTWGKFSEGYEYQDAGRSNREMVEAKVLK